MMTARADEPVPGICAWCGRAADIHADGCCAECRRRADRTAGGPAVPMQVVRAATALCGQRQAAGILRSPMQMGVGARKGVQGTGVGRYKPRRRGRGP